MWGLNVYIDQSGDVNLVSFTQAGVEADNELAIDRARSSRTSRPSVDTTVHQPDSRSDKGYKASKTRKEYEKNIVKAAISSGPQITWNRELALHQ